jgi:hypothetical protein
MQAHTAVCDGDGTINLMIEQILYSYFQVGDFCKQRLLILPSPFSQAQD